MTERAFSLASFTLSFIIPCHFRLIIIHVTFSMQMSPDVDYFQIALCSVCVCVCVERAHVAIMAQGPTSYK